MRPREHGEMKYSHMTAEQKRLLLGNPQNYPWRVTFLGKAGILSYEEIDFLQQQGVDFDLDDRQAEEILLAIGANGDLDGGTNSPYPS